jgi:hypothetical protein
LALNFEVNKNTLALLALASASTGKESYVVIVDLLIVEILIKHGIVVKWGPMSMLLAFLATISV